MANRNATFAKRQRETELKDRAKAKEDRRSQKRGEVRDAKGPQIAWDEAVHAVATDDPPPAELPSLEVANRDAQRRPFEEEDFRPGRGRRPMGGPRPMSSAPMSGGAMSGGAAGGPMSSGAAPGGPASSGPMSSGPAANASAPAAPQASGAPEPARTAPVAAPRATTSPSKPR